MLELALEFSPTQAYVGLTLAIPVFLTVLIAVACGLLFVLGAALGLTVDSRAAYTLTIAPLVALVVWGLQGALGWVRRQLPLGSVVSLSTVAQRGLPTGEVGAKAHHLASMQSQGARVAPGWVVRASVFEATGGQGAGSPDAVEALVVPRRVLRRLFNELESSGESRFLLRSSFGGEDEAGQAAPGIYQSVCWARTDGIEGLSAAMREVWSSYWGDQAVDYRALRSGADPAPRLAVLAQPLLAHERSGVASSVDLVGGGRERHLVDAGTWRACHDVLSDRVVVAAGVDPALALPDDAIRHISRLVASAEEALGRPAEIEWGLQDGRVTLYQARALTGEPPPTTLTNRHLVELPREALTPLSHAWLWGEGAPGALLSDALVPLGLSPLADGALRVVHSRVMLDVTAFKALALGLASGGSLRSGVLLGALLGRTGCATAPLPPRPDLALRELSAEALAARLVSLRTERLVPLVTRQIRALVVASSLDGWLGATCGEAGAPAPQIDRPDTGDAWYRAEREAELATPRYGEGSDPAPEAPSSGPAGGSRSGLLVRWIAWARDRQLTEREVLNAEINVANHVARQHALMLDQRLAETVPDWVEGDVFFCTPTELCELAAEASSRPSAAERAARRLRYEADDAASMPGVCELDSEDAVVPRRLVGPVDGALATGAPVGQGQVSGPACIVGEGQDVSVESAQDAILIVHGGSPRWGRHVLVARGLVLLGAGPLSHLSLLGRERGIPVLAGAMGSLEGVQPGDALTLDLSSGSLRRSG